MILPLRRLCVAFVACLCTACSAAVAQSLAIAHALARQGKADAAIAQARGVLAGSPRSAEAHELLCQLWRSIDRFDDAVHECEAARDLQSGNSGYSLELARSYGAKADHAGALTGMRMVGRIRDSFERAAQLDPKSVDALSDLGEFYVEAPSLVGRRHRQGARHRRSAASAFRGTRPPSGRHDRRQSRRRSHRNRGVCGRARAHALTGSVRRHRRVPEKAQGYRRRCGQCGPRDPERYRSRSGYHRRRAGAGRPAHQSRACRKGTARLLGAGAAVRRHASRQGPHHARPGCCSRTATPPVRTSSSPRLWRLRQTTIPHARRFHR